MTRPRQLSWLLARLRARLRDARGTAPSDRPSEPVSEPPPEPLSESVSEPPPEPLPESLSESLSELLSERSSAPPSRAPFAALGAGERSPLLLGPGAGPARQVDATTCGSAVLVVLAAAGDPGLACWVATGEAPGRRRAAFARLGAGPTPDDRFAALQRLAQRASVARALGPLPWPTALGTPPWGAARQARFGRVRYDHRVVDDTDPADVRATAALVRAALERGVPVPLYAGGDTSGGLAAAVPRHVVLVVARTGVPQASEPGTAGSATDAGPAQGATLTVYEPGAGALVAVDEDALWSGAGPLAALGGWSHVCWVLAPRLPTP